jgi:hypothetical protein
MSLIPVYPQLQQISRRLIESGSSVTFQYSYSKIRLGWNPLTSEQKRAGLVFLGLFISLWVGISVYNEEYLMLIPLCIIGVLMWHDERRKKSDVRELRLQNDIQVDSIAQQILVEHLNEEYRQQVAKEQLISFRDVIAIGVQASGYAGILYLELINEKKLFLLEVEAENIAQHMANALRQIIGLPEPMGRPWWQF